MVLGTILNGLAAVVIILPLIFARQNAHLKFRTKLVAEDEAATKVDGNTTLRDAIMFSRDCAMIAFPLLIFRTALAKCNLNISEVMIVTPLSGERAFNQYSA